jgi:Ca-activated chloride channel family protein
MSFLEPQYLNLGWALFALAIWFAFALHGLHNARRVLRAVLDGMTSRPSSLFRRGMQMLLLLAVLACLILATARPQATYHRRIAQFRPIDAMILLDTSPSMRAQDILPSRLFRSTEVIGQFLRKKLPDDRFGLISFSENSLVLSYLTADPHNILFYLDYLREQSALQYGTNIGGALKNAMEVLSKQGETNKKVLILLSDGEDHGEQLPAELRELVDRGLPAYCVGIGSRGGVLIPIGEEHGRPQYLTGPHGAPLLTTFDESTLREIAERSGGRYYPARTAIEMNLAFNDIFLKTREIAGYRQISETREYYPFLLAAAFVLFLVKAGL